MTVVPIVEGHGEVAAFPELLRRMIAWISPQHFINVAAPIRTHRNRFLNDQEELRKLVQLAWYKASPDGWVLVLLDADDDCPVELSANVSRLAVGAMPQDRLSVVIANREYEAWYIAASSSLQGHRGFHLKPEMSQEDPDRPRDAKGWMARQMPFGYHEVTDQPAFSAVMDLELAWNGSRSFRRLCAELVRHSQNLST